MSRIPLEEADRAVRVSCRSTKIQRALAASVADFLRLDSFARPARPRPQRRAGRPLHPRRRVRPDARAARRAAPQRRAIRPSQPGYPRAPRRPGARGSAQGLRLGMVRLRRRGRRGQPDHARAGGRRVAPARRRPATSGRTPQSGSAAVVWRGLAERLSFSRDFSSGFAPDRDYRNLSLASTTHARTRWAPAALTLAHTDRPFGADQFYGNFNSWERTRTWFASAAPGARQAHRSGLRLPPPHRPLRALPRPARGLHQPPRQRKRAGRRAAARDGRARRHASATAASGTAMRSAARTSAATIARAAPAMRRSTSASLRRFSFSVAGREEFYGGGHRQFSPTAAAGFWASLAREPARRPPATPSGCPASRTSTITTRPTWAPRTCARKAPGTTKRARTCTPRAPFAASLPSSTAASGTASTTSAARPPISGAPPISRASISPASKRRACVHAGAGLPLLRAARRPEPRHGHAVEVRLQLPHPQRDHRVAGNAARRPGAPHARWRPRAPRAALRMRCGTLRWPARGAACARSFSSPT